jgi:Flp pilus assembly protein TadG
MRLKNRKGASSVVEFALILPLFLLLIFGVIDFGYYFFVQQTLQFATREGVRLALTGRTLPTFNREASIIVCIMEKASVASLDPARLHVYIYPVTADFKNPPDWSTMECGSAGPDVGGPGDYMRVKTTYAYKFLTPFIGPFFPGGEKTMEAQATYRNELF